MVITNGFSKAGNHALVKACQLLGQPCKVDHIPYDPVTDAETAGRHIYIKRDPRNIVCSWLRFTNNPVTPGTFIAAFRKFAEKSLIEEMATHEGWLKSTAHVVRFEDLIASDATMRDIANHLGIPYIAGAFEALPGMTRTWHADHSDYTQIWTPEVDIVWLTEGGPALLARWGY